MTHIAPSSRKLLSAIAKRGGTVTKSELHRIFKPILAAEGRTDMNYGGLIGDDDSRALRRRPNPLNPDDELVCLTKVGYEYLAAAGEYYDDPAESEDVAWNEQFRKESGGESLDEAVRRKMNKRDDV